MVSECRSVERDDLPLQGHYTATLEMDLRWKKKMHFKSLPTVLLVSQDALNLLGEAGHAVLGTRLWCEFSWLFLGQQLGRVYRLL